MIFSQRYIRAIKDGRLSVIVPMDARSKLWLQLKRFNASVGVQRDPNDRWIDNSSILTEVESDLPHEYGLEELPGHAHSRQGAPWEGLHQLVIGGHDQYVLDVLEMAFSWMEDDAKRQFRAKVNEIMELHDCLWRIADGEFLKLDEDFVAAKVVSTAFDALGSAQLQGAANEYGRARQDIASGDAKDAILYATKSVESVLKVLTGLEHANADRLIKEFSSQGYLDDLPESVRAGFCDQVMKALPYLRNKIAGHGQGAEVIRVANVYAELAVQLAGAFHNFLIAKYLNRIPLKRQEVAPPKVADLSDDIPF